MPFLLDIVFGAAKDAVYSLRYAPVGKPPGGALIVSYPKSGRTWLRAILARYLELAHGITADIDPEGIPEPYRAIVLGLPPPLGRVAFSHSVYQMADPRRPVAVLLRDPRDTLVSDYHWRHRAAGRHSRLSISEFLRSRWGVWRLVRFHNTMARYWEGRTDLLHLSYEALHEDTAAETRKLLLFLGLSVDPEALSAAVSFARFEKMQARERNTPRNAEKDVDSLKVRKGKVGGYREELGDEDIAYVERYLDDHLDRRMRERMLPDRRG
jgi:hypothetical protein